MRFYKRLCKNTKILLPIACLFLYSTTLFAAAGSESYQKQIAYRGPLQANLIDVSVEQIDEDLKTIIKSGLLGGVPKDPEYKVVTDPNKIDASLANSLRSFQQTFLKVKDVHDKPLNASNSRVYIIGGSMEYFYFRAQIAGIPGFMSPDQFRFLAVSRNTFYGSTSDETVDYVYQQIQKDLAEGRDIILFDSVSRSISLRHTHDLVQALVENKKSKSRVISFGIPEQSYSQRVHDTRHSGFVSGARSLDEYKEDIRIYGWSYYEFGKPDDVAKVQSVARFAQGKFFGEIQDGFPVGSLEMPESLTELLPQYSIKEMVQQQLISFDEAFYLFNRLRALRFYQKTKELLLEKNRHAQMSCQKLFVEP